MLTGSQTNLKVRSRLLQAVRTFFYECDYTEVETPVRVTNPALEDYIDAEPSGACYLRTSPELHMKQMLAAGWDKIFQIGACFRKGEKGSKHRPEFTMLEWYRCGANYTDILSETYQLLKYLSKALSVRQNYFSDKKVMTVADAFHEYAGKCVIDCISQGKFEEILCDEVEPNLGRDHPLFLTDYPASMAALSRRKSDDPKIAERWELYIDGLEIANAYSELTDPEEQRNRFKKTQELRLKEHREVYEIDEDFIKCLDSLPECGGIAVGLDRMCMVFTGSGDIGEVISFS